MAVTLNTYMSLIFLTPMGTVSSHSGSTSFFSLTAKILTPLITSKLKAADKIRHTLDQYPKPSSFNVGARNFDDSADGVEDIELPSDGSRNSGDDGGEGLDPEGMLFNY